MGRRRTSCLSLAGFWLGGFEFECRHVGKKMWRGVVFAVPFFLGVSGVGVRLGEEAGVVCETNVEMDGSGQALVGFETTNGELGAWQGAGKRDVLL